MAKYDLLDLPPKELLKYLFTEFNKESDKVPRDIETVDDMIAARRKMLRFSAEYSYLVELLSCAKIMTRELKRTGTKEEYEDMIDRREVIANCLSMVDKKYTAISRVVTIKQECNRELNMQQVA